MTSKERCLAAIQGNSVDRTPVFPLLMFLAADRLGVTYREFATNGHVMAEAQLKTREMFGIDAITACSDAFRISADLGGDMVYPENKPPFIAQPLIRTEEDFRHVTRPDVSNQDSRMADRTFGVREMVQAIGDECLVLGWVDMPFAEACSACGVSEFMLMLHDNPKLAHKILEFLTDIVIDFCRVQIEAGAPMIGTGDAAASLISPAMFREFALPYEQRVCSAVHAAGGMVKLHICGNTSALLPDMAASGADLFNVDHLVDFSLACEIYTKAAVCFKGNINPIYMLQATPEECAEACLECLQIAENSRYMLSAGCEVPAGVSDDVFQAFCETPKKVMRDNNTPYSR